MSELSEEVFALRRFNRRFTQRIGVLDDRFLGRDRPLGQARLLFEVGPHGASVFDLRRRLGLDSGYLSRLLRALEADGLLAVAADPADGRRRVVHLTDRGRAEWQELDRRSDDLARRLLEPLTPSQRQRLEEALTSAERLLLAATVEICTVDPLAKDAVAAMNAYFAELNERFPAGFDPGDALVAEADHYRSPAGVFVVACSDAEVAGCGGVTTLAPGLGEIKRMWIAPPMRGLGLGRRLLAHLEDRCAELGHGTVRLDSNSVLTPALSLYRSAGYVEIDRYNDNPYARHWFEKRLG